MDVLSGSYWAANFGIYIAAFSIGFVFSLFELTSRYKDAPFKVLTSIPSLSYMAFNGIVSIIALFLMHTFDIRPEVDQSLHDSAKKISDALYAGIGAMLIFRSSLVKIKTDNGKDLEVGLAEIATRFLSIIDREIDKKRAVERAQEIAKLSNGIDYSDFAGTLKPYCMGLLQNISNEEIDAINAYYEAILADVSLDEKVRPLKAATLLYDLLGNDALTKAIESLVGAGKIKRKSEAKMSNESILSNFWGKFLNTNPEENANEGNIPEATKTEPQKAVSGDVIPDGTKTKPPQAVSGDNIPDDIKTKPQKAVKTPDNGDDKPTS